MILLISSGLVQTSLLFIVFVNFKCFSLLGLKVGGRMLSGVFGAADLADFFTICNITFVLFSSFLPFSFFGPPGSGVGGLLLRGRSGSL